MKLNRIVHTPLHQILAVAALTVVTLLAGCEKPPDAGSPPHRRIPQVSFVAVKPEKIIVSSQLPGRTTAFRVAEIRPRVSGLILKRLFEEGSDVKAGQVLYQIDPAPFQAALDNAKAALGRAEASLSAIRLRAERYKELVVDKAVSRQDYDDAAAALTQAEADIEYWKATVKTAAINLEYTRITAPISGRIGKSNVTEGAVVTAYQPLPLATVQQLDPIYVDVPQSTADMLRLKHRLQKGLLQQGADQDMVSLVLEDGTDYPRKGTLKFSDVTVDPTTASVTLRAVFPNPEGTLLPGMFVRAVIREGINEQAILVPQQAVFRDPRGNPFALIVDAEQKAAFRPLSLDRAIGDKWLVTAGLAPGDRVIVEGLTMLRPGTPVQAVPFDPSRAGHGPGGPPAGPPRKPGQGGE